MCLGRRGVHSRKLCFFEVLHSSHLALQNPGDDNPAT